jgi:hypothetical protein
LPIEVHRSKEHLYLTICKFGFFDQTMMDETGAGACPIGHCQAGQDQANVAGLIKVHTQLALPAVSTPRIPAVGPRPCHETPVNAGINSRFEVHGKTLRTH